MDNETKRYGKTVQRPEALPLGTIVEDVDGEEFVRGEDGWRAVDEELDAATGPLSVTDLALPLRIVKEGADEKANLSRERRRKVGRRRAKAAAKKVLRQVHAAEEERELSRLEALEDRDRVRNGEEVGA